MYRQIKKYIQADQARFSAGIILLTDMGSPNDFGKLIEHELGTNKSDLDDKYDDRLGKFTLSYSRALASGDL